QALAADADHLARTPALEFGEDSQRTGVETGSSAFLKPPSISRYTAATPVFPAGSSSCSGVPALLACLLPCSRPEPFLVQVGQDHQPNPAVLPQAQAVPCVEQSLRDGPLPGVAGR